MHVRAAGQVGAVQVRQWHSQGTSLVATTCRQSSKATLSKQCKSLQMPFLKVLQQTGEVCLMLIPQVLRHHQHKCSSASVSFADSGNAKGPLQSVAFVVLNMAAIKFFVMRGKVCFRFPESSTLLCAPCQLKHLYNGLKSISLCWLLPRALLHLSLPLCGLPRKSSFPGLLCLCIEQGLLSLDMTAACECWAFVGNKGTCITA